MDFPSQNTPRFGTLTPYDGEALADLTAATNTSFAATATTWGTNQRAVYTPVTVLHPVTVYQMAVRVFTQAGNIDVGIYDLAGNRIVSLGATAMAAAGVQTFNITDTLLPPGYYSLAVLCNTSTAVLRSCNNGIANNRVCGIQMQDVAADNLPATATFAAMAVATTPLVVAAYSSATF